MKAPSRPPYVDLYEAVRVVVKLMPDGEGLAEKITDRWISGAYKFWDAGSPENEIDAGSPADEAKDNYRDHDALMRRLYGDDWRCVRPRVIDAYASAVRVLEKILRTGRVPGFGVTATARERGRQPIETHEWASRELDIRHKRLDTPGGQSREFRPPINDVLVCVEDLQRECAEAIGADAQTLSAPDVESTDQTPSAPDVESTDQTPSAPALESMLRELRRENPNLTQTTAEKIARERGAIEKRQEIRDMWKSVGGSSTPGPKGPRKNRAAPPA